MFFATNVLLSDPPDQEEIDLGNFFIGLGRRFFTMFAVVQVWIVGIDLALTGSFVVADSLNVILAGLAIILALNSRARVQLAGIWTAWGLSLAAFAVQWLAPSS